MNRLSNSLKSDLSKAKNLGSSGSGSHHWVMQRLSAILMVLLIFWLFCFIYQIRKHGFSENLIHKPANFIPGLLLLTTGLYHGVLGMQVVVEDYVSCLKLRNAIIIKLKIISVITIFTLLIAAVYFISLFRV